MFLILLLLNPYKEFIGTEEGATTVARNTCTHSEFTPAKLLAKLQANLPAELHANLHSG
jgi:hypothetical protein